MRDEAYRNQPNDKRFRERQVPYNPGWNFTAGYNSTFSSSSGVGPTAASSSLGFSPVQVTNTVSSSSTGTSSSGKIFWT